MKTKVKQFEGRNGAVKNQFELHTPEGNYFQSYDSIIVFIPKNHPLSSNERNTSRMENKA